MTTSDTPSDTTQIPTPPSRRPQPESLRDLFWSFTHLALQGFGGVLAVVQRELVEKKKWLTREEFVEDWAVAQILPGPNVVNLSLMIGDRYFGMRGALTALAGILTFPLILALALAAAFAGVADSPSVQGALQGMGAVAAGLIGATGLKLVGALKSNVMGLLVCWVLAGVTFVAIALLRIPLAWVLLVVGSLACGWAYRQLGLARTKVGAP
jgi:chromate transporter